MDTAPHSWLSSLNGPQLGWMSTQVKMMVLISTGEKKNSARVNTKQSWNKFFKNMSLSMGVGVKVGLNNNSNTLPMVEHGLTKKEH